MTKKILITGKNSYIGNYLAKWLEKEPRKYEIIKKSVRDGKWEDIDFSTFDVVVHVAGIAHQDMKNDSKELYYKVNTDLTIDIATKAKKEGVKQFIFLSSMIVYGSSSKIGEIKVIKKDTIPEPSNYYGNSKLRAEEGIQILQSMDFNVAILRPPMIYGKKSKGNYPNLAKFAKLAPIFPDIENQRSMLHIDNLVEFIKLLIENNEKGIYFPQNRDYVKTSDMVRIIASVNGKKIRLVKFFNPLLVIIGGKVNILKKVFGNLVYEKSLSQYKQNYQVNNLEESIKVTELFETESTVNEKGPNHSES